MGVAVREKVKGSGVYWIFVNHNGKRTSKKVGDEDTAKEVAGKIQAKITLGDFNIENQQESCPTFKEYAKKWLAFIEVMRQGPLMSAMRAFCASTLILLLESSDWMRLPGENCVIYF
jgi:hypothetical protein